MPPRHLDHLFQSQNSNLNVMLPGDPGVRPSDGWLQRPASIDGGVMPPRMYYTLDHMKTVMAVWNPAYVWDDKVEVQTESGNDIGFVTGAPSVHAMAPPADPPAYSAVTSTHVTHVTPAYSAVMGTHVAPVDVLSSLPPVASTPSESRVSYLVTITFVGTEVDNSKPVSRNSRASGPKLKKVQKTKIVHLYLEDLDRCSVVQAALEAHSEQQNYSPGPNHGPLFKMFWTGLSKSNSLSIEFDQDFASAVTALKQRKGRNTAVTIEFDFDNMDPYKIRKRVAAADDTTTDSGLELSTGTKVPRLDLFSEEDRMNGCFIMYLQAKWKCAQHPGEHGQDGYCYIDGTGQHLGLNMRKMNTWAAAMAAGEATKNHPPNSIEFDGLRDGHLTTPKPRGRNGPHSSSSSTPPSDINSLLMAATVGLLTNTMAVNQNMPSLPPSSAPLAVPRTPSRSHTVNIPSLPASPIPTQSGELHNFLFDLRKHKGVDFTSFEPVFESNEYTPDVLPLVSVTTLCELTGAPEGRVLKMVEFSKAWYDRLQKKRKQISVAEGHMA